MIAHIIFQYYPDIFVRNEATEEKLIQSLEIPYGIFTMLNKMYLTY